MSEYKVRTTMEMIDDDGNMARKLVDEVQTFASRYTWNGFANATVEALLELSKQMNELQAQEGAGKPGKPPQL